MVDTAKRSEVPALDRGLDVLELVSRKGAASFGNVLEILGLPSASTARILKRLCQRGYLVKDVDSGSYEIGDAVEELMPTKGTAQRLREAGAPILAELRDRTTQTAILFYWNGQVWECIGKELHESSVTMQLVGEVRVDIFSYPWSCFAFEQLERRKHSLTLGLPSGQQSQLTQKLEEYQRTGYVADAGGWLYRLAVPIKDGSGDLLGALALGITPPVWETMGEKQISDLLVDGGKRIEKQLSR